MMPYMFCNQLKNHRAPKQAGFVGLRNNCRMMSVASASNAIRGTMQSNAKNPFVSIQSYSTLMLNGQRKINR